MKTTIKFLTVLAVAAFSSAGFARNTIATYSIQAALSSPQAKRAALGNSVRFYFGNQPHGKIIKNLGSTRTNRKTNAFLKSDEKACEWAFLSALKALRGHALAAGGNAVINIKSNYKNHLTSHNTRYTCGAGATTAGVALVGTIVKL